MNIGAIFDIWATDQEGDEELLSKYFPRDVAVPPGNFLTREGMKSSKLPVSTAMFIPRPH